MDITEKIKDIIVDKLGINREDIKPESSFTNDLGADSLDTVELMMEVEKEFDVNVPDAEMEKVTTVGEMTEIIEKKIKEKPNFTA